MAAFLKRLQVRLEALPMDAMGTSMSVDFVGDNEFTTGTCSFVRDGLIAEIDGLLREAE